MEISFNAINDSISTITDSNSILESAYNSDWDDEVHDSFGVYISMSKQLTEEIATQMKSIINLEADIANIDVGQFDDECANIIAEIESV